MPTKASQRVCARVRVGCRRLLCGGGLGRSCARFCDAIRRAVAVSSCASFLCAEFALALMRLTNGRVKSRPKSEHETASSSKELQYGAHDGTELVLGGRALCGAIGVLEISFATIFT